MKTHAIEATLHSGCVLSYVCDPPGDKRKQNKLPHTLNERTDTHGHSYTHILHTHASLEQRLHLHTVEFIPFDLCSSNEKTAVATIHSHIPNGVVRSARRACMYNWTTTTPAPKQCTKGKWSSQMTHTRKSLSLRVVISPLHDRYASTPTTSSTHDCRKRTDHTLEGLILVVHALIYSLERMWTKRTAAGLIKDSRFNWYVVGSWQKSNPFPH